MFKQTILSAALPYRLPFDTRFPDGIPNGIGVESNYAPYLVTAPRIYSEELNSLIGGAMFTRRQDTATTNSTISILCYMNTIYWPGWEIRLCRFDGTTGVFIDATDIPWGAVQVAYTGSVIKGFDGSIWTGFLYDLVEISEDLLTQGQTYTHAHFGRISCTVPVVDKVRDIVIMPSEDDLNAICVYTLSTGALIRSINVSDHVKYICPVDGTRVFVLGTNNLLNLVDYSTNEILMTALCPTPGGIAPAAINWDLIYRRLLLFVPTANNSDGSGTSQIHGYYPVPIPTQMMTPIPLEPLRKGKVSPVLTRMTGDVGEPVAGQVMFSDTGDASMVSVAGQANGLGYAINGILCTDAGTTDVTVSATV